MMRRTVTLPEDGSRVAPPPWYVVLRSLRRAAGITQEGWAARLGYGRRTIQRWEHGDTPPDAAASEGLIRLCGDLRLYRDYRDGPLAGLPITADWLTGLLANARVQGTPASTTTAAPARLRAAHLLSRELTSFVGRERERAEIGRLLGTARLLTLTGPGGVGKTRLALKVAADRQDDFPDGVRLVELGSLAEPSLVPAVVARGAGARAGAGRSVLAAVIEHIGERRLLLLLDNCEHLRAACAALASDLLGGCPNLCLLATSRVPLALPAEQVWPVPPLGLPVEADAAPTGEEPAEAMRLLLERARAVWPGLEPGEQDRNALARICRRLDGLPLAIELAAPWLRLLSPAEVAQRLDDRFAVLRGRDSNGPARHQALRAALDWSYHLLSPSERARFDRLAVFAGSFTLESAAAVLGETEPDVLLALAGLVDASLVVPEVSGGAEASRYRLLETLREYGRAHLAAEGGAEELRQRLADWLLERAEVAGGALHGSEQAHWLGWVACEHANLRAVLEWALERQDALTALRLTDALWWAWGVLGLQGESRTWLERAVTLPATPEQAPLRGRVIARLGMMAILRGDLDAARQHLDEVEALAAGTGVGDALLQARVARTQLLQVTADPDTAERSAAETLALVRHAGDTWLVCRVLEMQAHAALRRGDHERAAALLEDVVRLARGAGDAWSLATALAELGDVARWRGAHVLAGAYYRESLDLRQALGIPGATPSLQHNLGYVALARMDFGEAARRFESALWQFRQLADRRGMAECLIGLACILAAAGSAETAAHLFGAGEAALGGSIWPSNRADYARAVALVRAALDARTFDVAWNEGCALSLDAALAIAQSGVERFSARHAQASQPPTTL